MATLEHRSPIFVVDDDPEVIAIVKRVLGHAGWHVEGTTDPRVALEQAIVRRPCLIFVDLMMPHMDGEELLIALRDRMRDAMPKVVLISAAYSRVEVAKRLEVDASLPKPFELGDLRDLASRFAGEHRDRSSSQPPR